MSEHSCLLTNYGFQWGPMEVARCIEHRGMVVITVKTSAGKQIDIAVSPKGQSIRVFGDGGEWKKI